MKNEKWRMDGYPFSIFRLLRAGTGQRLLLPFYHLIDDDCPTHIKHLYPVRSTAQFREDLDFLLKHYQPISPDEVESGQWPLKKNSKAFFSISFDDGLRQCYDVVAPILEEKGLRATFFLNSAFIGNEDLMFRYKASLLKEHFQTQKQTPPFDPLKIGYLERHKLDEMAADVGIDFGHFLKSYQPYMSHGQVKDLLQRGFSLGAHSIDHPLYNQIPVKEQLLQTEESMRWLESTFGVKTRRFALPFTDDGLPLSFFRKLVDEHAFKATYGGAGVKLDTAPQHFQRVPMEKTTQSARFILTKQYAYWWIKAVLGKNLIKRQD